MSHAAVALPKLSRRRIARVLTVLALVLAAGWAIRDHYRYRRFAAHDPGKVYRSHWLAPDAFAELIEKYKIRTVVNLCDPSEKICRVDAERKAVESAGGKLVEICFPANDTWHVDDPAFRQMEQLFDDPAAYPIWIHCWHGRERTVKALSIYDIRKRNLTAYQSLTAMPLWGREHPWPMISFAYSYESLHRERTAGLVQKPTIEPRR